MCEPADEPIRPTALLLVAGEGATWTVDGRRSYSGWDDHDISSWEIDLDDGTVIAGDDVLAARVTHTYGAPGDYEVALTVTDDTGRSATTTQTISVPGDAPDEAPPAPDDTDEDGAPALPATGGGLEPAALLVVLAAAIGSRLRRRAA